MELGLHHHYQSCLAPSPQAKLCSAEVTWGRPRRQTAFHLLLQGGPGRWLNICSAGLMLDVG